MPTESAPPPRNGFSRTANLAVIILAAIAVVAVCYVMRPVLFPLVLATLIAGALKPVARFLCSRLHFPSVVAAAFLVVGLIALSIFALFSLHQPATKWIEDAPRQMKEIERKIRPVQKSVDEISKAAKELEVVKEKVTESIDDDSKVKVEVARPTLTATVLGMTTEFLLETGIALAFLFLLLAYGDDFVERLSRLPFFRRNAFPLSDILFSAEEKISRYLMTFSLINAGLGIVIGFGLWIIGLPNPFLWGVMAACLNFIPYLGLSIGATVVFFVALVTFDSILYAALAPLIYGVANLVEANAVTPRLLGKTMGINVIVLFMGILLIGWLWGAGGVIIAVPLMATFRTLCDHIEPLKPVAELLDQD